MPRFVLLFHECPPGFRFPSHWDLMLESDGALRTWALSEIPSSIAAGTNPIPAQQLPDHRIAYLEYEGPVSENRGQVTRWDTGEYELVRESDQEISLLFSGQKLAGRWQLVRQVHDIDAGSLPESDSGDHWLFGRA